jgi:hypothetical protein
MQGLIHGHDFDGLVDARGGFDERFASWEMASIEFSQAGTVLRSAFGFFGAGFGVGDTCGNSIRPVLDAQSAIKHSTRRSRLLACPNP